MAWVAVLPMLWQLASAGNDPRLLEHAVSL
jgi:hypothetical protein